ncbi:MULTISPECIES: hypothetical protein [unclassified Beijerinckia]|uniref:LVIVD repeat-containing protein n=1 Tax=unclassified Beijerinckia TaxID=2638183 RepID=UPI0008990372|nr:MULTISPECIES: hypothetical protein [unclassified Beijerinckia]MDH7797529.1 hypothetical protein [Beijerinckia sp. GAS462]SEC89294.1 Uncharacterized conserved protein [Beijerinckia sp. 28-YEA-48]
MAICKGVREVGRLDCSGGGQIVVDGDYGYIGHMSAPSGTSIVDLSDPSKPKTIAHLTIPWGLHSHKVQAANGLMLVNHEIVSPDIAAKEGLRGGLGIYDISNPHAPREITRWQCDGTGVHRFTFDGRYAYISPEIDGYIGNIVMILDLADPVRPREVGRWWMPGQWIAGGETPSWPDRQHRCHHAIRRDDRLYVSYWHGGGVLLDISDMSQPKQISGFDWSPPFPWPTHSLVPVPFAINGRRYLIVADEDVNPLDPEMAPELAAFIWIVDATDETRPVPVATFQVEGIHGKRNPSMTGCHQPVEIIRGTEVPVAWFAQGLRFLDISNPMQPRETAHYIPDAPAGRRASSNDVFMDERGLVYLMDRVSGLSIVERI